MKYEFDKEKHLHQIKVNEEWKNLTGCTTVLSVISKPQLIPWAAKMAVEYIRENCVKDFLPVPEGEIAEYYNYSVSEAQLEEAKKAHAKRKEQAGDYGTKLHEEIETLIKEAIKNGGYIAGHKVNEEKPISNFIDWALINNVKFLESEKNVYSEKLWTGGIVDFVCEIDGEVWVGDIKTSGSGIYPEHFWQVAGYDLMLKDMGLYPQVKGYLILNLKENGEIIEKRSISNGDNTKAFLACLEIYRISEKIKNQVI